MALINCPDCGTNVSDQAEVCRICGRPIKNHLHAKPQAEEAVLDLFNPYEAEMLRRRIAENEHSLNAENTAKAKEAKLKKQQREDLLKKVVLWALIGLGIILTHYIRRNFF